MYHLELKLVITHEDAGEPIEAVKTVIERISVGDENHKEMPGQLRHMVVRLFDRLKEVDEAKKKKIIAPGLVMPTGSMTEKINRNRVFGG